MMTKTLEEVFLAAADLPEAEQAALATWIRAELADERRWSRSFAQSADALADLAAEALAEHRAGEIRPLDLESM